MNRRELLACLPVALGAVLPAAALAQAAYPAAPVKVLVGFPPGTATDIAARAVAEQMARRLGQPFVMDNRPGAGSNIAAKAVATAQPDGYNLFAITVANSINAAFPNSTAVDPVKDFTPITLIGNAPNVLVVHPSLNVSTVAELIAHAKAKPGGLSYASSGIGTSPHLSGELFAQMTGVKLLHIPYRGSLPAVTDLLGGQVQMMFSPTSTVLQHVRAGKLKALAVTSARRTAAAPEIATLDELGLKGFNTSVWIGLVAPAGTPEAVAAKLRAAAHAALDSAEVQATYRTQGLDAMKNSGEEFTRFLRAESTHWSAFIQAAGIKPE
ncbi:tripartite tricarboxylate transporter substrate binding protein [Ramlibacter sp. WS9]|uniref:tripartite tricarboxylate transporter substrate binding protein n=1 Tax=Ramlibacter sp. WS9 TaxID=1882741 RepID=UPI001142C1D9|nr:tripartite tricarboxylate transporter substrate binding protein [Ramlibacter sp. WS9]ROZ66038.1 tripartite tricarboxylate transporter substrate binding protein [Ramlibacter sp. WS9]